jgi:hypothetical protein
MTVVKHPPFCEIPGSKGKRLRVDVHFINGGKTPAIGTRTHRRVIVADDDSAEHTIKAFDIPSYTPAGSTTGAGVDSFVTAVTEELTDAQITRAGPLELNLFTSMESSNIAIFSIRSTIQASVSSVCRVGRSSIANTEIGSTGGKINEDTSGFSGVGLQSPFRRQIDSPGGDLSVMA